MTKLTEKVKFEWGDNKKQLFNVEAEVVLAPILALTLKEAKSFNRYGSMLKRRVGCSVNAKKKRRGERSTLRVRDLSMTIGLDLPKTNLECSGMKHEKPEDIKNEDVEDVG
ncbi:hypothetical protein Tco_0819801 [Tanacetum coccineum]|uniref:Uncharacterized protein n=1 Tax=Tanacetum coccineum TaxID=301880 RepID=A0ABQ5AAL5_9ASTR